MCYNTGQLNVNIYLRSKSAVSATQSAIGMEIFQKTAFLILLTGIFLDVADILFMLILSPAVHFFKISLAVDSET